MGGRVEIRPMVEGDWPTVADIYGEGIESGQATFETHVPRWADWNRNHDPRCRLVAEREGVVVGWAALSPVSSREVYSGVAEVSIYVSSAARDRGIGSVLMSALVTDSEREGFWTLQAGIFPENEASIHLHERNGFRVVGVRERIGKMSGIWRDVVFMERRRPPEE